MRAAKEIPDDFMRRLPTPRAYYSRRVKLLGDADAHGMVEALCPLARFPHGHRVRIDMRTGNYSCATCGRGDLLLFHMLYTGHGFKASVLELIEEATP